MISYAKALRLIEKISINLKNEKISSINSINRVSAENVLSPNNNPLSNNAAFDGFAILSKETKNLSKKKVKKFKILKTIAAGDNPKIRNYKKNSIIVYCLVSANSKTGVEMEALSGVSSALLAIYDLSKIVEPNLKISNTKLLVKSGGKKGLWINPDGIPNKIKNILKIKDD